MNRLRDAAPEVRVLAWLRLLGVDASTVKSIEPLTGGLVNFVFRIGLTDRSVILKMTPPYVASIPEVALDDDRARFEQAALRELGQSAGAGSVRVPGLVACCQQPALTLMDDAGPAVSLAGRLPDVPAVERLATWLTGVHAQKLENHVNEDVARVRLETQYKEARAWFATAGIPDSDRAADAVVDLGTRWLGEGPCLIHGDLWPPSVLYPGSDSAAWVIDWEFSTMGWPAQDLGDMLAHLALHGDDVAATHGPAFLAAYERAAAPHVLRAVSRSDTALHAAAEMGMRTFGPFHDDPSDAETARRVRHITRFLNTATY